MDGSSTSRASAPAAKTARRLRTASTALVRAALGTASAGRPAPSGVWGRGVPRGRKVGLAQKSTYFTPKPSPLRGLRAGLLPGGVGSPSPGYLRGHPAVPERPVSAAVGEQQLSLAVEHPVLQLAPVLGARRQRVGALSLHPARDGAVGRGRAAGSAAPRRAHLPRTVPPR